MSSRCFSTPHTPSSQGHEGSEGKRHHTRPKTSNVDYISSQFFALPSRQQPTRRDLKLFLDEHLASMRPANIMFFLYQAGRKRYLLSSHFFQQLLTRLNTFPPEEWASVVPAQAVRKGFYGLRAYSVRPPPRGGEEEASSGLVSTESVSNSVAFRGKKVPSEIMQYIHYMTSLLLASPHRLSGETVSLVLYGIQGLGSEDEAVRRLLHVLYHKLERHSKQGAFSAREVSQCLYGLKNMGGQVEVLRMVRVLASELDLVRACLFTCMLLCACIHACMYVCVCVCDLCIALSCTLLE